MMFKTLNCKETGSLPIKAQSLIVAISQSKSFVTIARLLYFGTLIMSTRQNNAEEYNFFGLVFLLPTIIRIPYV